MNREIKFRVWNSLKNKMVVTDFHITCFGIAWKHDDDFDMDNYYIPMQYTGFKDVNSKEIYEGDILEWTSWKPEHFPYKNVVEFYSGGTMCGFRLRHKSYSKSLTGNGILNAKAIIIGNIYENPELINPVS